MTYNLGRNSTIGTATATGLAALGSTVYYSEPTGIYSLLNGVVTAQVASAGLVLSGVATSGATTVLAYTLGSVNYIRTNGTQRVLTWPGGNPATLTGVCYGGGKFYVSATVTISGVTYVQVMTSTDGITWTGASGPSAITPAGVSTGTTSAKVLYLNGFVYLVYVENNGGFAADRLLLSVLHPGVWTPPVPIVSVGTGPVSIGTLSDGSLAVAYVDYTMGGPLGYQSLLISDTGASWTKFGIYSQTHLTPGFSTFLPGDGICYTQSNGNIYVRTLARNVDAIDVRAVPMELVREPNLEMDYFMAEMSLGDQWVCISDHISFYVSPEGFGEKAQVLRRTTAESPYYDGEFLIHSVKANVNETVAVYVLGASQNQVTENLMLLEEIVAQSNYRVRVWFGDHVETWDAQAADYTISRGHVLMHNARALFTMSIPRLPYVLYEVN